MRPTSVLLRRIEAYLRRSRVSATRFGIEAARDPKLVPELRAGRIMRPRLRARVEAHLKRAEQALRTPSWPNPR
ncbi:MAG TPA: hypothetical protein VF759_08145 [Allosphingosinicella sp.]